MRFYATCPTGLEHLLASELESLGASRVRPLMGQVSFEGPLRDAYTACMWSRMASTIVAVIEQAPISGPEDLYQVASAIPWEEHLAPSSTFAVFSTGESAGLDNTRYVSQRVKDAIVDRMLAMRGVRPNVDTQRPDLRIRVRLREGHLSVGIDLSGAALFQRGYERAERRATIPALRADYAAAMLWTSGWQHMVSEDVVPSLAVAFAGNGSLVAEAAQVALDRAPGLLRVTWGFTHWLKHAARTWTLICKEAEHRADQGKDRPLILCATDSRDGYATAVRSILRAAGIDREPEFFSVKEVMHLGERLSENRLAVADLSWLHADEAPREAEVFSCLASLFSGLPEICPAACLTRDAALDALLGTEPQETLELKLGKGDATLRAYDNVALEPAATVTLAGGDQIPVLVPATDQFAARLEKVAKARKSWAQEEDVTCYRVYDQDLPDYNVALDLFQGAPQTPGRWLVVQEYAAPKEIDAEKVRRRLIDVLTVAPRVVGVRGRDVALRVRQHSKGGSQYAAPEDITRSIRSQELLAKSKAPGARVRKPKLRRVAGAPLAPGAKLVEEGGLLFEINLVDRLDCGLFLDHRLVRAEIREMAKAMQGSKRFLNLFAYTGTGTVYAADGGAGYTTTVDLSYTYLDWAQRNMERNGFVGENHEYIKADVLRWVDEQRRTKNRWDLIYCDPPTFSNSSSMGSRTFDVQADHAELLIGISRLLTRDGVCLFSCNLRNFTPDVEALSRAGVEIQDVTQGTIPQDFERNAKIHHVYLVRRTPISEEELAELKARRAKEAAARGRTTPSHSGRGRRGNGATQGKRPYGKDSSSRQPRGQRLHGAPGPRRGGRPTGSGPQGQNRKGQGRQGGNRH